LLAQPALKVYLSATHQVERLFSTMVQAELLGSLLLRQPQLDQSILRFPEKVFGAIQTFQQFVPHLLPQWCSMAKKKGPSLAIGRGEKLPASKGAGLTAKGRAKYNAATGSNLKAPQPQGGKRKDSFCARMSGMPGPMKDEKGKPTRKAASLARWKC
jgi:hypothetical protein